MLMHDYGGWGGGWPCGEKTFHNISFSRKKENHMKE